MLKLANTKIFILVPGWCLLYVASPFSNFIQYWASLSNFQDFDRMQKFESNCALFTWLTKCYDVMLWFLLLYLVNKCFLLLPCHCNPLSHEIYNLPPAVHWQQGLGKTDLNFFDNLISWYLISTNFLILSSARSISTFILKGKDLGWHCNQTEHQPTTTTHQTTFKSWKLWNPPLWQLRISK